MTEVSFVYIFNKGLENHYFYTWYYDISCTFYFGQLFWLRWYKFVWGMPKLTFLVEKDFFFDQKKS